MKTAKYEFVKFNPLVTIRTHTKYAAANDTELVVGHCGDVYVVNHINGMDFGLTPCLSLYNMM